MDRIPKIQAGRDASTTEGEAVVINRELIDHRGALLVAEPKLRGRALAQRLGVSEAQLLLLERGCSSHLRSAWPAIIGKLRSLGTVMAFTRNECVLHEKIGSYGEVILNGSGTALVI